MKKWDFKFKKEYYFKKRERLSYKSNKIYLGPQSILHILYKKDLNVQCRTLNLLEKIIGEKSY